MTSQMKELDQEINDTWEFIENTIKKGGETDKTDLLLAQSELKRLLLQKSILIQEDMQNTLEKVFKKVSFLEKVVKEKPKQTVSEKVVKWLTKGLDSQK